jgi:hypothetical protein
MKKNIILFILSLILLFSNCIFDEDSNDDRKDGQSYAENYLPSSLDGSVYKIQSVKFDNLSSVGDTLIFTASISGPVMMDGHEYYTISSPDVSETLKFCVETNNIYLLVEGNMFPVVGSNPDTPFGYNSKFFDFSVSQGNKYDILDWGTTTDELYILYHFTGEFLGYETVETQLGEFKDCAKFQIQYNNTFTSNEGGLVTNYSRTETYWFAPNTGPVKRVGENFNNGNLLDTTTEEWIDF